MQQLDLTIDSKKYVNETRGPIGPICLSKTGATHAQGLRLLNLLATAKAEDRQAIIAFEMHCLNAWGVALDKFWMGRRSLQ